MIYGSYLFLINALCYSNDNWLSSNCKRS